MANNPTGSGGKNKPDTVNILGKEKEAVTRLAGSPDAQALMKLLNQKMGSGLQEAAQEAIKGDASKIIAMMEQIVKTPEGAAAVNNLNQSINKK